MGELDAAVHYFHPWAITNSAIWDSLVAEYVTRAADASTTAEYHQAIRNLVGRLDDPATRVVAATTSSWTITPLPQGALLVRPVLAPRNDAALEREMLRARVLVMDLRGAAAVPEDFIARLALPRPARASAQRAMRYHSIPYPGEKERLMYHRAWRVDDGERFDGGDGRGIAFLVDSQSALPSIVLALRNAGRGAVIGIGTRRVRPAGRTYRVRMGEGLNVDVRIAQRLVDTTGSGVPVDTTVRDIAMGLHAAIRWADRAVSPWPEAAQDTLAIVPLPLAPAAGLWARSYPSRGYRLLAAARLWSTMRLFFPYKAEMGGSWDAAFRSALPAIERANDSLQYVKGIAELATHLRDSHVRVWNSDMRPYDLFGAAHVPAVVQFIEGRLVMTRSVDSTAWNSGLRVGDVITAIDGEPTDARIARLTPFVSASTAQALRARLASVILAADDSVPAQLSILDARGITRTVRIPRSSAYRPGRFRPYGLISRDGPVVRVLPGNIGYIDVERIEENGIDSAFAALAETRGIVFDARGYPTSSWFPIISRLSVHADSTMIARFEILVVASPDTAPTSVLATTQFLDGRRVLRYRGRTALLIDERAISSMEHFGLAFETMSGGVMVGSATTGANGPFAFLQLPGSILVSISGARVRHADGRPLQRIGLQPDIHVAPTIDGLRQGTDDVLTRAISCLTSALCSRGPIAPED